MILPCSCSHDFQDAKYGRGLRLFNPRTNNKLPRCTVCGRDSAGGLGTKKDKK